MQEAIPYNVECQAMQLGYACTADRQVSVSVHILSSLDILITSRQGTVKRLIMVDTIGRMVKYLQKFQHYGLVWQDKSEDYPVVREQIRMALEGLTPTRRAAAQPERIAV